MMTINDSFSNECDEIAKKHPFVINVQHLSIN